MPAAGTLTRHQVSPAPQTEHEVRRGALTRVDGAWGGHGVTVCHPMAACAEAFAGRWLSFIGRDKAVNEVPFNTKMVRVAIAVRDLHTALCPGGTPSRPSAQCLPLAAADQSDWPPRGVRRQEAGKGSRSPGQPRPRHRRVGRLVSSPADLHDVHHRSHQHPLVAAHDLGIRNTEPPGHLVGRAPPAQLP